MTAPVDDTELGPARHGAAAAELLSVLATLGLIAWLPFLTRSGRWPVTILVALALLVGLAGVLVDLMSLPSRRRRRAASIRPTGVGTPDPPTDGVGTFTTIVVLGDEPPELQRNSVVLAHEAGPCIVVAPPGVGNGDAQQVLDGLDLHLAPVTGTSAADCLRRAVEAVDTDAALILSGRAAPIAEHCRSVAGRLDDRHPWAVGAATAFNADRYGADTRGRVDSRLRRRSALVGLALWESNATMVLTDAIRRAPFPERRPRGAWLRARQREGASGLLVDEALSMVAAPSGAGTFWPESMAQQRGAAADASHAVRSSHGTARFAALLVTLRSSFAWTLLTWLVVLFIGTVSGELPFRTAHGGAIALAVAAFALRWIGLQHSVGLPVRPLRDLRATVDRVPGSLGALPSVLTGRVLRGPRKVAVRPLLWAGLLSVAVLITSLVDHGPDARMTAPAVAAALFALVLLWIICIQVLVQRGWERASFRIPMRLGAVVGDRTGRTVDGSPEGLAIELPADGRTATAVGEVGSTVSAAVQLDDGTTAVLDATVAWVHHGHRRDLLGLSLALDPTSRPAWAAQVLRSAASTDRRRPDPGPAARRSLASRTADVAGMALTVVMSLALLAVLGGAMLGLQVAVVRSGSMTPTIAQGSIVVSQTEAVQDLRPGDVVTRPGEGGAEPVTHRLVSATQRGDELVVRTKGDANETGETWTIADDARIQRVRWTVPSVGEAVSMLRSNLGLVLGVVVIAGLVIAAVRLPHRRVDRAEPLPA